MEQSHEATQWEDVSKPHMEVQSQDSKPESPDTCLLTDSRQSSQTGIIGRKKKKRRRDTGQIYQTSCVNWQTAAVSLTRDGCVAAGTLFGVEAAEALDTVGTLSL